MRILRVEVEVTDFQVIELPNPARILSVAPARTGGERIDVWFIDYEDQAVVKLRSAKAGRQATVDVGLWIVGTGNPMPPMLDNADFLGTCVMPSDLVWHVFAGSVKS